MENPQLLNAMLWLIVVCIGVVLVWSVVGLTADLYDLMYGPRMGALKKEIAELKKQLAEKEKEEDGKDHQGSGGVSGGLCGRGDDRGVPGRGEVHSKRDLRRKSRR